MTVPEAICGLFLAAGLVTDCRSGRVPNAITLSAAIAGLVFHWVMPSGQGWGFSVGGVLLGGALLALPFSLGGLGGGDLKLLAGMGAWLGPGAILQVFIFGALIGGVWSLLVISLKCGKSTLKQLYVDLTALVLLRARVAPRPGGATIPYAVPIAAGFLVFLFLGSEGLPAWL